MGNPFLDRMDKLGKSGHGKLSEKRLAKELGARLHPASGAIVGHKSDASDEQFQYEMKSTTSLTLPLDKSWLEKISHEANCANKTPAITISFVLPDGKPRMRLNSEWVMVPKWAFQELVEGR